MATAKSVPRPVTEPNIHSLNQMDENQVLAVRPRMEMVRYTQKHDSERKLGRAPVTWCRYVPTFYVNGD